MQDPTFPNVRHHAFTIVLSHELASTISSELESSLWVHALACLHVDDRGIPLTVDLGEEVHGPGVTFRSVIDRGLAEKKLRLIRKAPVLEVPHVGWSPPVWAWSSCDYTFDPCVRISTYVGRTICHTGMRCLDVINSL